MKYILRKLSGGSEINVHAVTFWITLICSSCFFLWVILTKF